MSYEEEDEFLAPFEERAKARVIVDTGEIEVAYSKESVTGSAAVKTVEKYG